MAQTVRHSRCIPVRALFELRLNARCSGYGDTPWDVMWYLRYTRFRIDHPVSYLGQLRLQDQLGRPPLARLHTPLMKRTRILPLLVGSTRSAVPRGASSQVPCEPSARTSPGS